MGLCMTWSNRGRYWVSAGGSELSTGGSKNADATDISATTAPVLPSGARGAYLIRDPYDYGCGSGGLVVGAYVRHQAETNRPSGFTDGAVLAIGMLLAVVFCVALSLVEIVFLT